MSHIPHPWFFLMITTIILAIFRVAQENHKDCKTEFGKTFNTIWATITIIAYVVIGFSYW